MSNRQHGKSMTLDLRLTGLTCADCAAKLEQRVRSAEGVEETSLNFMAAKMTVRHRSTPEAIIRVIEDAGYGAVVANTERPIGQKSTFLHTHHRLMTTVLSALLVIIAFGLSDRYPITVTMPLYIASILVGGLWTIRRGLTSLRHGIFDMNALMTIAVIGASAIGDWNEAATVAVLYSVSNMLEAYTMEKTRHSLRSLMELAPADALVKRDGQEVRLPIEQVHIGDVVIVKPGEKIAVDGTVLVGASTVNQAAITGESFPVEKHAGSEVYAGTLNELGALEISTTALANDSALARITHMVEEAQARRAPSQAFVDRFARYYTPLVLCVAVLVAIIPPLCLHEAWMTWIYRALALIVVACPCALVISTPVAIVSAIGNAARHGVLIKGGAYLEQVGRVSALAFDKTGTLTMGRPVVTDIIPVNGMAARDVLAMAAAVENRSAHVLAAAVLREAHVKQIEVPNADGFAATPGRGVQATLDGTVVYVGNRHYFTDLGMELGPVDTMEREIEQQGKTAMLVGTGNQISGIIAAADQLRPQARGIMEALHSTGIKHISVLTGDHRATAEQVGRTLGVDAVRADLLPADKAKAIQELQTIYGPIAMVGDGVNDAPSLATADIGIAMGVAGTDTALETADIALMADDLTKLPYTIRLSRAALRLIKMNIVIALAIKALAIALIFPGWLTLWLAVLADMGASIIVTLNGLRLVRGVREPQTTGALCHDDCCCGDCHHDHDSHHADEHGHTHCLDGCCHGH